MKQITFTPIEEKTLNDKLVNLYGSHLVGLYTEMERIYNDDCYTTKPSAPLFIELEEYPDGHYPYEEADIRVMICGRENNNWNDNAEDGNRKDAKIYTEYGTCNFHLQTTDDILAEIRGKHMDAAGNELPKAEHRYGLTDLYINYLYGKDEAGNRETKGKTRFTRRTYDFIDTLQRRVGTKRVEFVWNNLYKIGKGAKGRGNCCGMPPAYIRDMEKQYFDVFYKEIEILKPDVIIFMPINADNLILEKFGLPSREFQCVDNKFPELRRIEIPGIKYAARTLHPSSRGIKNEVFEAYNNVLIDDILKHI